MSMNNYPTCYERYTIDSGEDRDRAAQCITLSHYSQISSSVSVQFSK